MVCKPSARLGFPQKGVSGPCGLPVSPRHVHK
jgi:hypothetical protein